MRFVDPPNSKAVMGRWSYDWLDVGRKLRANPGEWLLLDEEARLSVASAIRQGSIKDFHPTQGFEVTVRNTQRKATPPTCTIYVRYNPEKEKA